MFRHFPPTMQALVAALCKLPSIGERSAVRLAYHLVQDNQGDVATELLASLKAAREAVRLCSCCFHLSEAELCSICSDPNRDASLLCVVEKPMDLIAMERVGDFRGMYHVLHGLWSPLRGQLHDSIRLSELRDRVFSSDGEYRCSLSNSVEESSEFGATGGSSASADGSQPRLEVIVATSATVEGDATALYIAKMLKDAPVRVTRLAQGMQKGAELEYADELTLSRALSGRSPLQ